MRCTVAVRPRAGTCVGLVLLLLTACGGGDDPAVVAPDTLVAPPSTSTPAPGTVLAVTVRGGSVVDGAARQRATLNQSVTIRVTTDAADEVHVHGYDRRIDVAAGRTGEVTFLANIPGVFEVEFERSRKVLFTMEVR